MKCVALQVMMGCSNFGVDYWYFVQYRPEGHMGKPELLHILEGPAEPNWLETHAPVIEDFWAEVLHWRAVGWESHPLAAQMAPKPIVCELEIGNDINDKVAVADQQRAAPVTSECVCQIDFD
jgi:hypothetical protein